MKVRERAERSSPFFLFVLELWFLVYPLDRLQATHKSTSRGKKNFAAVGKKFSSPLRSGGVKKGRRTSTRIHSFFLKTRTLSTLSKRKGNMDPDELLARQLQ